MGKSLLGRVEALDERLDFFLALGLLEAFEDLAVRDLVSRHGMDLSAPPRRESAPIGLGGWSWLWTDLFARVQERRMARELGVGATSKGRIRLGIVGRRGVCQQAMESQHGAVREDRRVSEREG